MRCTYAEETLLDRLKERYLMIPFTAIDKFYRSDTQIDVRIKKGYEHYWTNGRFYFKKHKTWNWNPVLDRPNHNHPLLELLYIIGTSVLVCWFDVFLYWRLS